MQIGVVFPQTEIGADPSEIAAYAEAVEEIGYQHLGAYDHVLGADPAVHTGWAGPYDVDTTFHEPLVLFGYLAAMTTLELVTGILILPQRQTALVAKQAAEVDLLTGGRFRLGVGVGWNAVEYQALGTSFSDRGPRLAEQVALLRELWTERSVSFEGRHEQVRGAGIAPLPVQRPIPIWFGASSPPAYRRAGALGDGWFPLVQPGPELDEARRHVAQGARDAGRDPAALGMEGRIRIAGLDADAIRSRARAWAAAGATHLSLDTMGAGLRGAEEHVGALERCAELLPG